MSEKKQILYISYDYPPMHGGQARLNYHVVKELKKHFDVTIVTNKFNTDTCVNYTLIRRGYSALVNCLFLIPVVGRRFDLVVAGDSNFSGFIAGLYGFFCRKKVINICHGKDYNSWIRCRGLRGRLNRSLYRRNTLTIANSAYTKKLLEPENITKRCAVVNPGVDTGFYRKVEEKDNHLHRLYIKDKRPVLLTAARLIKRKGVDNVLHALSRLDRDFLYFVIGSGPEKEPLEKLSRELGLEQKVIFLGKRSDDDILRYYNFCDIFILTPREIEEKGRLDFEGFGMVYLEANACAKPVIASDTGGVAEAVRDGYSGILVPPDDAEAVKNAIIRLVDDKALYNELCANSRKWAERFDWSDIGNRYVDEIKGVLDAGI